MDARHHLKLHPLSMGSLSLGIGLRSSLLACKRTQFISLDTGSAMSAKPYIRQPLHIRLIQQCEWSVCLTITGGADNDERTFGEAFRLEPGLAATTSIFHEASFETIPSS
jgi:hypothetical protein